MRSNQKSTLIKRLIYCVLLLLVVVTSVPYATKWYVTQALESDGYNVKISSLGINIFTGGLHLHNLAIVSPKADRLNALDAHLDMDMAALLSGKFIVEKVELDGAVVDLHLDQGKLLAGGFDLTALNHTLGSEFYLKIKRLSVANSQFCVLSKQQCFHVEAASANRVELNKVDQHWSFEHKSSLSVNKVFLSDIADDESVFYVGAFGVSKGLYSLQDMQLTDMSLKNFQFVKSYSMGSERSKSTAQTQIGELTVSELSFVGGESPELVLGNVIAISPRQSYIRSAVRASVPDVPDWLANTIKTLPTLVTGAGNGRFAMNQLSVNAGVLSWRDGLVAPAAREIVTNIELRLGAIDSRRAHKLSNVTLSSKLGATGLVKFDGRIYPFGDKPSVSGRASIQDWDLSNIQAYTASMFKQQVNQGSIDIALDLELKNQQIDVDSRWQITGFKMDRKGSSLSNSMALLKDHNQSVRFALPISGDVASKNISLKHVFGTLIERKLKRIANNQMGSGSQVEAKGDLIIGSSARPGKMAFRSLLYSANAREPSRLDSKRLADIAKLLKSKPQLTLFFCPVSTGGEWAEIFNDNEQPGQGIKLHDAEKETLIGLASARGKALSGLLTSEGVFGNQVKICAPSIDMGQLGLSFVTISM